MNFFEKAKILAEISDLASKAYGILVDKSRAMRDRDDKIRDLERQIAELRSKIS